MLNFRFNIHYNYCSIYNTSPGHCSADDAIFLERLCVLDSRHHHRQQRLHHSYTHSRWCELYNKSRLMNETLLTMAQYTSQDAKNALNNFRMCRLNITLNYLCSGKSSNLQFFSHSVTIYYYCSYSWLLIHVFESSL